MTADWHRGAGFCGVEKPLFADNSTCKKANHICGKREGGTLEDCLCCSQFTVVIYGAKSRLSAGRVGGGGRLFICQYRGCTHRLLFCRFRSLFIYPLSLSVVFVHLSLVTLVAPSLLSSLPSSNGRRTTRRTPPPPSLRPRGPCCTCRKWKHLSGWGLRLSTDQMTRPTQPIQPFKFMTWL